MGQEVHLGVKVGDRVRYINECDGEEAKASGHYPPVGTWGTVTAVNKEKAIVEVIWDSGTRPGAWWVKETDIALLIYKEDVRKARKFKNTQNV